MNKGLAALGCSALAWSLMLAPASAKIISYEIDGKRYAYDSSKPAEIAAARKRIEAANAADRAGAIAAAERARNPLAAIFGSEAQRASAAAQAHLKRVLAEEPQAEFRAAVQRPSHPPPRPRAATAVERRNPKREDARKQGDATEPPPAKPDETVAEQPALPEVQSVFLDPETGIRTTFLADGSIREELVDATAASGTREAEGDRLARERPHEDSAETTGSTTRRGTDPAR